MRAKKALRDFSSKSLSAQVLVASVATGVVTTSRATMVVNPAPTTVYSAVALSSEAGTLQVDYTIALTNANLEESTSEQSELAAEIEEISNATFELNVSANQHTKSNFLIGGTRLGPGHFVGTIFLTHALVEGEVVGSGAEFTESEVQIEGADQAYYGFSFVGADMDAGRGTGTESTEWTPLYGWIKLDGTGSTTDPEATDRTEMVTVDWAYDTSGQSVMVGSAQPIPEPSTLGLAAAGILLAGTAWRRRRIKAAQSTVAQSRWQVWEAHRAEQGEEPDRGIWVIVAGEPQTIVGMAVLREVDPAEMLHMPPGDAVLLEIEMQPGWDKGAEALLNVALTRARQTSSRQIIFATKEERLVKLAGRLGFAKVSRKEGYHGRAAKAAAWLKARYAKALSRNPVKVQPIREAKLESVQRLVSAYRLLKEEQVRERGPEGGEGFDAAYSFFTGEAERPSALILGFEDRGRVRLHVRVRDSEIKDFPRHGMIGLMITFLESVAAAGVEEVSFVTRSGAQADFGTLARRWGARPTEFLETLRLAL